MGDYAGGERWENDIITPLKDGLYTVDVTILSNNKITKNPGKSSQVDISVESLASVQDTTPTLYIGDYEYRGVYSKNYSSVFTKCLYKINYVYPIAHGLTGRGISMNCLSWFKSGADKQYLSTTPDGALDI